MANEAIWAVGPKLTPRPPFAKLNQLRIGETSMGAGETYVIKIKDNEGKWVQPGPVLVIPPSESSSKRVEMFASPFDDLARARIAQADYKEKNPNKECRVFSQIKNEKGETLERDLDAP
jgi:hypothetical protein